MKDSFCRSSRSLVEEEVNELTSEEKGGGPHFIKENIV